MGSKAQLGELFFKERVLRLAAALARLGPHRHRRTLAAHPDHDPRSRSSSSRSALALILQLAQSRKTHLAEQNRQTSSMRRPPPSISSRPRATRSSRASRPSPSRRRISMRRCCPRRSAKGGSSHRQCRGRHHRQPPKADGPRRPDDRAMCSASRFITEIKINDTEMTRLTLASGEEAYVAHERSGAASRQPARHPEARRCHARLDAKASCR